VGCHKSLRFLTFIANQRHLLGIDKALLLRILLLADRSLGRDGGAGQAGSRPLSSICTGTF